LSGITFDIDEHELDAIGKGLHYVQNDPTL
jgi:hypothetical protein